ncbi:alpha/beta fold hydrolase [Mycobacterium sp.]|uniref:alpha/beta fold hydrolase n=1 Tax=Mycobacterium sp. TaxID=1785 RepID=UPI003D1431D8
MNLTTTTVSPAVAGIGAVPITFTDRGEGPVNLLLHGGGGSATVTAFADQLAEASRARVIVPVHPGFDGTDRPERLSSITGLASLYAALLDELDLRDVTVIGNSIGGWIAAELGLLAPPQVSRIVLVDAVGIDVPDHPVADFFSLTPAQVAEFSYADPGRFGIDPTTLSPDRLAIMAANREALSVYGGSTMTDATLSTRLSAMSVPTRVIWGEADRIVDPDYGRALAAAIPAAGYLCLRRTGHLPQIETPSQLIDAITSTATS